MFSNFSAFQEQAFALGQQLLKADDDDDDSDDDDLEGVDTGGFGMALKTKRHTASPKRAQKPTQDGANEGDQVSGNLALTSAGEDTPDAAGPVEGLDVPGNSNLEPLIAHPPVLDGSPTNTRSNGAAQPAEKSQWDADVWDTFGDSSGGASPHNSTSGQHHPMEQPAAANGEGRAVPVAPGDSAEQQPSDTALNSTSAAGAVELTADRINGSSQPVATLVDAVCDGSRAASGLGHCTELYPDSATRDAVPQHDQEPAQLPEPPSDAGSPAEGGGETDRTPVDGMGETGELCGEATASSSAQAIEPVAAVHDHDHDSEAANKLAVEDATVGTCETDDVSSAAVADGSVPDGTCTAQQRSQMEPSTVTAERDALSTAPIRDGSRDLELTAGEAGGHAAAQPNELAETAAADTLQEPVAGATAQGSRQSTADGEPPSSNATALANHDIEEVASMPVEGTSDSPSAVKPEQNGVNQGAEAHDSPQIAQQSHARDGTATQWQEGSVLASTEPPGPVPATPSPRDEATATGTKESKTQGYAAAYTMFGMDSFGADSAGEGSNDDSGSEGIVPMKEMLALGESVTQLQGWLWGKGTGSDGGKDGATHGEPNALPSAHPALVPDSMGLMLDSSGTSPLSMSRLSPTTVQRVKTAFSPLYTSGDLSATAHKDSNKLMVDSQGSSAAAGLVATTGGATQDVVKLQEALVTRESQLETQAGQLADLDAALRSLQKKNQELVLKGAKVSEEDMEELQTEFETRLGRAERRVFALTKERDTVKRQLAKAITPSTLQARDSRIAQLEGEKAEVEKRAVNLSHRIEDQAHKLTAKDTELTTLRNENATNASRAKQAERTAATAIADAESARAAARQATDTGKAQTASAHKKAHAEAADKVRRAEERARIAEEEGGAKVRAHRDQLADSVQQLQEQLAVAEEAYASEEERLQERILSEAHAKADAEERYAKAEAAVAAATQPLLRRVEDLTQELEACQGSLRAATAGEKRAESACSTAATENSVAAARAAAAERAMSEALAERDAARAKAAVAAEALAAAGQSLKDEQQRNAAMSSEAEAIAAKLEHTQLELQETRHLLATANSASQTATGSASTHTGLPSTDITPPRPLQPFHDVTSSFAATPTGHAAPAHAPAQNNHISGSGGAHQTLRAQDRRDSRGSVSGSMGGVVWVPESGLSVPVSQEGPAGDAEAFRDLLEQSEAARKTLEESMYTLAREATAAKAERDALRAEMEALQGAHDRHNAAVELLGEREERISELEADVKDMKLLYREQIDFMATQLASSTEKS